MNKFKNMLTYRVYSALVCVLALVLVIGVNLFVNELPTDAVKLDTTSMGLHTLSDSTKETVENLDTDIDIYLICQSGSENETIVTMLDRYADLSSHINFVTVDPAVNPDFVKGFTSESLGNNSIIVSSDIRNTIIEYSSIASYTAFKGEDYVTNAIKYVTSDELPVVYTLTGHGEKTDNKSLESVFASSGVQLKSLNLITENKMPEDIDCLFIYAPTEDITENEKDIISSYLENGGSLMLVSDYNFSNLPNLASVMDYYGVYAPDGIVVEGTSGMSLSGYPYYVLPEISSKSEITKPLSENSNYVLIPIAQAIAKNDHIRDTVEITDLFTSSANSYIVDDTMSFGYTAIEAMKSGTITMCKVPTTTPDWMATENGTLPNCCVWFNDFDTLHQQLASVVRSWITDKVPTVLAEEAEKIYSQYSKEQTRSQICGYVLDVMNKRKAELQELLDKIDKEQLKVE